MKESRVLQHVLSLASFTPKELRYDLLTRETRKLKALTPAPAEEKSFLGLEISGSCAAGNRQLTLARAVNRQPGFRLKDS